MKVKDLILRLQSFDGEAEVDIALADRSIDPEGSEDRDLHVELEPSSLRGAVSIWKNVYHLD